jgi:hypothetical protein
MHVRLNLWLRGWVAAALLLTPWLAQAQSCPIVTAEQVKQALPHINNWVQSEGGAGGCRFQGEWRGADGTDDTIQSVMLSFTQQFFDKPAQAGELLQHMRGSYAKAKYPITPLNVQGAAQGSFAYRLDVGDGAEAPLTEGWAIQVGAAILSGMLVLPAEAGTLKRGALTALLQQAAAATAQPKSRTQARQCSAIDEAQAARMLGGKRLKVEQFGPGTCMASNERNDVLMVSSVVFEEGSGHHVAEEPVPGCKGEPVPSLGPNAWLSYACVDGNKRAEVDVTSGNLHVTYTLIPMEREPTAAQRNQLIELVRQRSPR